MTKSMFHTLLVVYLMLLVVTGLFSSIMAGSAAMPPPADLEKLIAAGANNGEFSKHFITNLTDMSARQGKLSEAATGAFQVVVGALIGFLTAAGAVQIVPDRKPTP